jgi:hypothetical protein
MRQKDLRLGDYSRQGAKHVLSQVEGAPSSDNYFLCGFCVPSATLRTCFAGDIPNLWLRLCRVRGLRALRLSTLMIDL